MTAAATSSACSCRPASSLAGADDGEDVIEETAADEGVLADDAELVIVFDEPEGFDERCGKRREEIAAEFGGELEAKASELGDSGVGGIEACRF